MPEWIRHCIHVVGHMRFGRLGSLLLILGACGRTGLGIEDSDLFEPPAGEAGTPGVDARSIPDAPPLVDAAPTEPARDSQPPGCEPSEEICNGRDDDCDGKVDELDRVADRTTDDLLVFFAGQNVTMFVHEATRYDATATDHGFDSTRRPCSVAS